MSFMDGGMPYAGHGKTFFSSRTGIRRSTSKPLDVEATAVRMRCFCGGGVSVLIGLFVLSNRARRGF